MDQFSQWFLKCGGERYLLDPPTVFSVRVLYSAILSEAIERLCCVAEVYFVFSLSAPADFPSIKMNVVFLFSCELNRRKGSEVQHRKAENVSGKVSLSLTLIIQHVCEL